MRLRAVSVRVHGCVCDRVWLCVSCTCVQSSEGMWSVCSLWMGLGCVGRERGALSLWPGGTPNPNGGPLAHSTVRCEGWLEARLSEGLCVV